jgi:FKBP-type peptidyl-prolyl cis-trans isomerase
MKLEKYIYLFFVAISVYVFASCHQTSAQEQRDAEKDLLKKYIKKYHPDVYPQASGLYVVHSKEGTGDSVVNGNYVKIFYRGYLIEDNDTMGVQDGYMFDASGSYEPFGFTVGTGSVIAGWDEAILHMKQGGEAKWIVPSTIAYAGANQGTIPPYSTLVFYVHVLKVYRTTDTFQTIQKVPRQYLN